MKLSGAIREGAKLRGQAYGDYFQREGETVYSCALGGAYEAIYNQTERMDSEVISFLITRLLDKKYPVLGVNKYFVCLFDDLCDCSFDDYTLGGLIAHFNDNHKWTRERIADWLEKEGY